MTPETVTGRRVMRRKWLVAAGVLFGSSLTFAGDHKGIAWQDYTKATAAAKRAQKPVLVDFWRPG